MSQPHQNPYANESAFGETEKKPKGCLFYGCLFGGIALLLMIVLAIGAGIWGYRFLKGEVQSYTAEEPAEIPVVEAAPEQLAELQAQIEQLQKAVESGEPAEANEIVLTADQINALIASEEDLKGKVFIRIEEGEISGDVSIPADGFPFGEGRFFNASASFEVSYENGELVVTLKDATVKGEEIPEMISEALANENLAEDLNKDPEMVERLERFESIEVREDKLILRLKKSAESEASKDAVPPSKE